MIWTTTDTWILFVLSFVSMLTIGAYVARTIQKEKAKEPVPVKIRTYIDPNQ